MSSTENTTNDIEVVCEPIECESITTGLQDFSLFRVAKKGFVRLVKIHRKRMHALELYNHDSSKVFPQDKSTLLKPLYSLEITAPDTKPQCRPRERLSIRNPAGVVTLITQDRSNIQFLFDKINVALNDTVFKNLNTPVTKELNVRGIKISDDSSIKLSPTTSTGHSIVSEFRQQKLEGAGKNDSSNSSTQSATIPQKQFYSNLVRQQPNVLGNLSNNSNSNANNNNSTTMGQRPVRSTIQQQQQQTSENTSVVKRRRDDEETLKKYSDYEYLWEIKLNGKNTSSERRPNPMKLQSRNMNIINNNSDSNQIFFKTTTSTSTAAASTSRFKKSENQENQENIYDLETSPVKTWNRTFSSGKSCGKGFSNLGNTCYMNAILQCLINIPTFSIDLMKNYELIKSLVTSADNVDSKQSQIDLDLTTESSVEPQYNLHNCLCELISSQEEANEEHKKECLLGIKNAISKEATRFSGYQQHDAHEFLCQVLDQLKEDVDKINNSNKSKGRSRNRSTDSPLKINSTKAGTSSNSMDNPIVDNFQFEVTHAIECKK